MLIIILLVGVDINSMEKHIEFEALRDLKIDASFLAIPSANSSTTETIENINNVLNKMEHLSDAEKKRSIAELLIFGTSPTSDCRLRNDPRFTLDACFKLFSIKVLDRYMYLLISSFTGKYNSVA